MKSQFDLYQVITDKVIAQLEQGDVGKFELPWHNSVAADMPRSVNGPYYRGVNTLLLWLRTQTSGYQSPVWGTYKSWAGHGAQVRRGEHGTMIVFWKSDVVPVEKRKDEKDDGKRLLLRYYDVFNSDQVDGWTPPAIAEHDKLDDNERIIAAEAFFKATGAKVVHGGNKAFYAPSRDEIHLPPFCEFKDPLGYYATLGHETVHWTGHDSRLDRKLNNTRFGNAAYAMEELIAEWGSAFLCANLGIANEPRADHAQYLQSWLKVLKQDKKALFTAAGQAQKAVDFLYKDDSEEVEETA